MKIKARASSPLEEVNSLKFIFLRKEFFKKKGFDVFFPKDKYFQELWESDKKFEKFEFDEDEFENKFYKKEVYDKKISELYKNIEKVEFGLNKLDKINIKDFKKFNIYDISFSAYGSGGMYKTEEGRVIISIYSNKNLVHNIVHEIIHIGIERSWVEELTLEHWEKEALADGICKKYFSDILVDYEVQKNVDRDIFNLVMEENLDNLFSKIEDYKKTKK